ncbi:MAG: stage III sporulation protein AE [Oscillospiraceae bacterium]|jgi:stage III sporulation protein AE|nr:stage III sporulation protein AE [Oscillospiraceae bacterium]
MKKFLCVFLAIFSLLWSSPFVLRAEGETDGIKEFIDGQTQASGAGELFGQIPEESARYMKELGIDELSLSALLSLDTEEVIKLVLKMAADYLNNIKGTFAALLGIVLIAAMMEALKDRLSKESAGKVVDLLAALCLAGVAIVPVYSVMGRALSALKNSSNFITAMIPVLTGIMTAGGHVVSGAGYNVAIYGLAQVIAALGSAVLGPLAGIYLAFSVVSSVSGELNLKNAAKGIKSALSWMLGICSTIFVSVLTAQTALAGTADSVIAKTGRFVVGSAVPIIGSSLSDALSAIQGCLGLLKNVVGVFGVLSLVFIFAPVVVECLVWLGILNIAAFAADALAVGETGGLLRSVSGAVSLFITILIFSAVLLVVSLGIVLLISGKGV